MKKTYRITLPKRAEVKFATTRIVDGKFEVAVEFKDKYVPKEKKKGLPETWEECLKVVDKTEYITNDCEIYDGSIEKLIKTFGGIADTDRNLLPRGLGKSMLALCQLLVCRNAWWKQLGWKPDYSYNSINLPETHHGNGTISDFGICGDKRILIFPTSEVRDQFLESFRDLIEEAKELL